jgi:hypothetical protein
MTDDLTQGDNRRALDLIGDPVRRQAVVKDATEAGRLKELAYAAIDGYASIFDQLHTRHLDGEIWNVRGEWGAAVSAVVGGRVSFSPEEMQRYAESDEAKNDDKRSVGIACLNRGLNDALVDETVTGVIDRGRFESFIAALVDTGHKVIPELDTPEKPQILGALAARMKLN